MSNALIMNGFDEGGDVVDGRLGQHAMPEVSNVARIPVHLFEEGRRFPLHCFPAAQKDFRVEVALQGEVRMGFAHFWK